MATRKKKSLGDDPLSWLKETSDAGSKPASKKKQSTRKKSKKAAPRKTIKSKEIGDTGSKDKKVDVIMLEPVMAIDEAGQLFSKLETYLDSNKDIVIDGSTVNMIDTAMLQLLTVFVTELKNKKIKITWKNPSEELIYRATLLDLNKQLELN